MAQERCVEGEFIALGRLGEKRPGGRWEVCGVQAGGIREVEGCQSRGIRGREEARYLGKGVEVIREGNDKHTSMREPEFPDTQGMTLGRGYAGLHSGRALMDAERLGVVYVRLLGPEDPGEF